MATKRRDDLKNGMVQGPAHPFWMGMAQGYLKGHTSMQSVKKCYALNYFIFSLKNERKKSDEKIPWNSRDIRTCQDYLPVRTINRL